MTWDDLKTLGTPIAACIAVIGLFVRWILEEVSRHSDRRAQRRVAFTRFAIDVGLRSEYLMQANDVAAFEAQIATLEAYARNAKKFKFYGAQVHDAEAYNLVRNHMHILKKADAELLGRHILLDQFFVTEYQILLTQAFADLSLDRQKSAYARWVEAARAVKTSAGEDQKMLKRYPWLLLNEPLDGPEGQQGPNNRTYHNNLQ